MDTYFILKDRYNYKISAFHCITNSIKLYCRGSVITGFKKVCLSHTVVWHNDVLGKNDLKAQSPGLRLEGGISNRCCQDAGDASGEPVGNRYDLNNF